MENTQRLISNMMEDCWTLLTDCETIWRQEGGNWLQKFFQKNFQKICTNQTPKVHQIVLGTPLLFYFVSIFIVMCSLKVNYFSHPFIMYFTCMTECISVQQLVWPITKIFYMIQINGWHSSSRDFTPIDLPLNQTFFISAAFYMVNYPKNATKIIFTPWHRPELSIKAGTEEFNVM